MCIHLHFYMHIYIYSCIFIFSYIIAPLIEGTYCQLQESYAKELDANTILAKHYCNWCHYCCYYTNKMIELDNIVRALARANSIIMGLKWILMHLV